MVREVVGWQSTFREDLQGRGVSWSTVQVIVADSVRRRNLLPLVP